MQNSFGASRTLRVGDREFEIFALDPAATSHLPYTIKILLENLLRNEDGVVVDREDIEAVLAYDGKKVPRREIAFRPARVLLQDFTGVPALVDLAAMRDALADLGGDPSKVNPELPVELVIDHSLQVDAWAQSNAAEVNRDLQMSRNRERFAFLRWGQHAFRNFVVVPPNGGIVHQVNLEHLARVVFTSDDNAAETRGALPRAYPDSVVGTDSHTPMVNGLGVLGWGVGGIEAEAALLGESISLLLPEVIGIRLEGAIRPGVTATDLVLTITELLRKRGVVGRFVEFFGEGVSRLPLADRATIGNMSPEYGATCAVFPIDEHTLTYLRLTGRPEARIELVEAYARAQGLFHDPAAPEARYTDVLTIDLDKIEPSIAGPRRPQDRVPLRDAKSKFLESAGTFVTHKGESTKEHAVSQAPAHLGVWGEMPIDRKLPPAAPMQLTDGSIVIASITSCTNTSNPAVILAAGLLAKKAVERGLTSQPWVKTSLAPGSRVVTDYLIHAGLMPSLEKLGFHVVGYGCATCIGNSGPLTDAVSEAIDRDDLVAVAVLSGNRNFEGRIHSLVRANYLMSPPLVVAYAIAGRMDLDLTTEPLGHDQQGKPVFLADIWPSQEELLAAMSSSVLPEMFAKRYADIFAGDEQWKNLEVPIGNRYVWDHRSTYVRKPPYFDGMTAKNAKGDGGITDVRGARVLAVFGDSVTTDHISPAGSIRATSPAGRFLVELGVDPNDFNSYGARRGNHEVMMRGTFANVRLKNALSSVEGPVTPYLPTGEVLPIYDAAMRYKRDETPLIILAGKEYGSGSSRDWAAKGTTLLGVRAVIAESYERIHRSNLVGMGVVPLQFVTGECISSLGLDGRETFEITGLEAAIEGTATATVVATKPDGSKVTFQVLARVDTPQEVVQFRHGGILPYVVRRLLGSVEAPVPLVRPVAVDAADAREGLIEEALIETFPASDVPTY
jgi:aconitate hydratase